LVLIRQLDGVQFGDGDFDGTLNDAPPFPVGNGCSNVFGGITSASMLGGRSLILQATIEVVWMVLKTTS